MLLHIRFGSVECHGRQDRDQRDCRVHNQAVGRQEDDGIHGDHGTDDTAHNADHRGPFCGSGQAKLLNPKTNSQEAKDRGKDIDGVHRAVETGVAQDDEAVVQRCNQGNAIHNVHRHTNKGDEDPVFVAQENFESFNNGNFRFLLRHLTFVMVDFTGEFVGDKQADCGEDAQNQAELNPCLLVVAKSCGNGDDANTAKHANGITDGCAPGAHFAFFFGTFGFERHHCVVGNGNRRIHNGGGKYAGNQGVHIPEIAQAGGNGEQQHTGQKRGNGHAQQPGTGLAGLRVGFIDDLSHEKVADRIEYF